MSDDYLSRIDELMEETTGEWRASALPLVEEAMRIADAHQDAAMGVWLRDQYINHAQWSGHGDRAFVAFGWILAQVDRDPQLESECGSLMWYYKWILGGAADFPNLSRTQIEGLAQDMERRYTQRGLSLRAVHAMRSKVVLDMGDIDDALAFQQRADALPEDGSEDCAACETNSRVHLFLEHGDLPKAMDVGGPVLRGGQSCAEVPASTYSRLLMPLLLDGQLTLADDYQRRSARRVTRDGGMLRAAAEHLAFLAVSDQLRRAVNMLDKMLEYGMTSPEPLPRQQFFTAVALVARCLLAAGRQTIKLKPATGLALERDAEGRVATADIDAHFTTAAADLAARFDTRNGNTFISGLMQATLALADQITPLPGDSKSARA